jgi:hypothetical protein
MNFEHLENIGRKYVYENNSIIVKLLSVAKENESFDDVLIRKMISASNNYFDSLSQEKFEQKEFLGVLNIMDYELEIEKINLYKFISKETFENYYKKGKFQLGSLEYYREIENKSSRDEREGFSNIIINSGNRQIFASVISGFNKYIFSGTDSLENSEKLAEKFGSVCIKVKNIQSFADKIKKAINAKSWEIKRVTYTDFKAYSAFTEINDIERIMNLDINEEFFRYLLDFSSLPSVYCKPLDFLPENEIRLTFEMGRDVNRTCHFRNINLIKEFEVLNIIN